MFNQVSYVNSGTFHRTSYLQNITLSIQDIFIFHINRLIEHKKFQKYQFIVLLFWKVLKKNTNFLKFMILKQRYKDITILNIWLKQQILQIKHFQYKFFQNVIINEDTNPQFFFTLCFKLFQI